MKIRILGQGPLAEQACRLAQAAGMEITAENPDCVLPATEDDSVLNALSGERVLFDAAAWKLCSSRFAADEALQAAGVPIPAYFPNGSEPFIVKPDRGSFGRGIWVTADYCEVGGAVNAGFVTQEELPGDVWSVTVLGASGAYRVYPAAKLSFDSCRRRISAVLAEPPQAEALRETAVAAAEAVGVNGVLEVEAIFHLGTWKVIDLNARLPMLTPDALLEGTGVNLLTELCEM